MQFNIQLLPTKPLYVKQNKRLYVRQVTLDRTVTPEEKTNLADQLDALSSGLRGSEKYRTKGVMNYSKSQHK